MSVLSSPEIITAAENTAIQKISFSTRKTLTLAILAGIYIAMGGLLSLVIGYGFPEITTNNPGLQRLLSGAMFPLGLILVVFAGAELFTGNNAVLIPGLCNHKYGLIPVLRNWLLVYIGNFIGAIFFVYVMVYLADIVKSDPWNTAIQNIAEAKVGMSWGVTFIKGIGANWFVCLAVWLGIACRSAAGNRHTVPGGESLPQQGRLQLYAHILQGRPALLAVLPQHRLCPGYIHPQRPLLRILRCPGALNHAAVGLALRITQADGHSRRCGSFAFQAAVVRQILGIEIHLVGKNDQICAHADQILFPLRQHRPPRLTVYADPRAVHPDQGILRRQAAGLGHRSNQTPCLPRPQGRVSLPAQVPHLTESPDSGCFPAVKAREIRHRHLFQSNFL